MELNGESSISTLGNTQLAASRPLLDFRINWACQHACYHVFAHAM